MQTHFLFFLLSHFVSFWPFNSSAEVSNTLLFYYFLHEKFEIFSMPTFLMNDVGNEIFLAVEILSILCTQGVLIKFTYASHPFASPPIVLRSLLRLIPSFSCPLDFAPFILLTHHASWARCALPWLILPSWLWGGAVVEHAVVFFFLHS